VKWRGFRIELGEIENALRRLPGVTAAAARLHEDGATRLVGYVVPPEALAEPGPVFAALRESLPAFIVPGELIALETLPLTPSGKIDRARLPAPSVRHELAAGEPPVFSPTETRLREIWREVLGVAVESREADFFALGGHSLLAVRLFARMEAVFGGSALPLAALFRHSTLGQLAALVDDVRGRPAAATLVLTLKPGEMDAALVFVPGAGAGLLWGYTNLALRYPGPHAICALPAKTEDERGAAGSVGDLAAWHVARLRTFQPRGPYHLAGYCFGGNLAYEMARQLAAAGERIGLLAVFDSAASNSDYYRVRLNRRFLAGFTRNLWLATAEFARLEAPERRERLRLLGRKFARHARASVGASPVPSSVDEGDVEIDGLLPDRALYPASEIALWRSHLQMMARYWPHASDLRLVLFRTCRRPLWRSHEPSLGWSALARGGVDIELVPGTHGTLFREPHVAVLAEKVAARMHALRG
jgi:thioesterase domain-containing protein